jgi:hypothetical protein
MPDGHTCWLYLSGISWGQCESAIQVVLNWIG